MSLFAAQRVLWVHKVLLTKTLFLSELSTCRCKSTLQEFIDAEFQWEEHENEEEQEISEKWLIKQLDRQQSVNHMLCKNIDHIDNCMKGLEKGI